MKGPMLATAESVARSVLRACARHRREVVLTLDGGAMVIINKVAPRFVDYMTKKVAMK